jgi:hypothetical protein
MTKAKTDKVVETRYCLITVNRSLDGTTVLYTKKPKRDDPNQLKMF